MKKLLIVFVALFIAYRWFSGFTASGRFRAWLEKNNEAAYSEKLGRTIIRYHQLRGNSDTAIAAVDWFSAVFSSYSAKIPDMLEIKAKLYEGENRRPEAREVYRELFETYTDDDRKSRWEKAYGLLGN